jgi:TetR/AcrR family transcriptional repressor of nem operon
MTNPSTREQLLQVGLLTFHQHGYTATGIQEILEAAKVPKGSFYHHFGSKEEFAREVVLRYVQREAEHIEKVLRNSKLSPLKRLRLYFKELSKIYGQTGPLSGCLLGAFSLEVSKHSEVLRALLSESFQAWQKAIEEVLHAAVQEKELSADTRPAELAAYLLNGWEGAVVRSLADKSDKPFDTFISVSFSHLLRE